MVHVSELPEKDISNVVVQRTVGSIQAGINCRGLSLNYLKKIPISKHIENKGEDLCQVLLLIILLKTSCFEFFQLDQTQTTAAYCGILPTLDHHV